MAKTSSSPSRTQSRSVGSSHEPLFQESPEHWIRLTGDGTVSANSTSSPRSGYDGSIWTHHVGSMWMHPGHPYYFLIPGGQVFTWALGRRDAMHNEWRKDMVNIKGS